MGARPPYRRIAEHYRALIASGELPAGEMLPSIKAISDHWEVSKATADRAVRLLREERLVQGVAGVGTEVLGPRVPISSGLERHDRSGRTRSVWGAGERSEAHHASVAPVPPDVAAAFGLEPGDDIIRRSRVYRDSHGLIAHSTSWIPREFGALVPDLLLSERLVRGISLDLVTEATGRQVATRIAEEQARIATPADLALLELPADTTAAILVLTAQFSDADGALLEYGVDLGAPGRTRRTVSELS